MKESMLRSPVSIEKAGSRYFAGSSASSFFDALENLKGVQMITPSIGFRILNTRGFANTTNVRFAQLVDGMDVQSPHIGSPIGNALGPNDLDINKVEILPGVASALYGMNTINGLADFSTKNPFQTAGLSMQQKTAVLNLGNRGSDARLFSETSLRRAKIISSTVAFKLTGTYSRGSDWVAYNYSDLNLYANASTNLTCEDNPAKDPVNSYGNESSNRRTLNLSGNSYVVARIGYPEKGLTNYEVDNIRLDGGTYYKTRRNLTISYLFKVAYLDLDNVYQRANRFTLQDYHLRQHGVQLETPSIKARVYINAENTGQSYNMRSMGENIDRRFKTDNQWFLDYSSAFTAAVQNNSAVADAHRLEKARSDEGRFLPGTPAYDSVMSVLQKINDWDSGAALNVKASFLHAEMKFRLTEKWLTCLKQKIGLEILAGFDHRTYFVYPAGNYSRNPVAGIEKESIKYSNTGGFTSLSKNLLAEKLRLGFIIRTDKNDYFPLLFNPRFTSVYSVTNRHHIRFAYQNGYRYPIIFEAYSNVNSGGVKRVGGLPVMSQGIFEHA
jgi:iron complex outermembrane receptor protein